MEGRYSGLWTTSGMEGSMRGLLRSYEGKYDRPASLQPFQMEEKKGGKREAGERCDFVGRMTCILKTVARKPANSILVDTMLVLPGWCCRPSVVQSCSCKLHHLVHSGRMKALCLPETNEQTCGLLPIHQCHYPSVSQVNPLLDSNCRHSEEPTVHVL